MRSILLLTILLTVAVPAAAAPPAAGTIAWDQTPADTRTLLDRQLASPHWTFRVFGLLRLERYHGHEITERVRAAIADPAWQVRCFALHAARRLSVDVDPDAFSGEADARVMRAAVRAGIEVDPDLLRVGTQALLRAGDLDDRMLGLEIAAASNSDALRTEARRRVGDMLRAMNDAVAARVGDRLARMLGASPPPQTAEAWRRWAGTRGNRLDLAPPAARAPHVRTSARSLVATFDDETFARLVNYLDGLRSTDLEVAVVMDATTSMLPMINEARTGIDHMIRFFSDLAGSMRLAFIVYRDHDNEPVWEGERFTDDVDAIRRFLWNIRITGGRDLPEAVYDGLQACGELAWSARAERRVILVGDARPHDEDEYRITQLLEAMRSSGLIVHAVHVPMRLDAEWERRVSEPVRRAYAAEVDDHNVRTEAAFVAIARLGGGRHVTLEEAGQLVPSLMRFAIDEAWWPAFDEFYGLYLELCR